MAQKTDHLVGMQSSWLRYLDINPPASERDRYGLSGETGEHYIVNLWQTAPWIARTEDLAKHAAREEFWLDKIRHQHFISARERPSELRFHQDYLGGVRHPF